ncbi:hypothetical protein HMPREF1247_0816 [Atopobium sp. BV3Ac4]|nr:hypothetical protein HMPREF1247_0816 [Atopobium sp. BV3Ac4]
MFYQRSGFENAPFGRVLAIARYLGCRPEDLITEEEDQKHEIEH